MKERLEGVEQQPTLPSTDVVLAELKMLRQREGVSHERVQRYAPTIQTLPCVIDERVQRRFSAGDEYVAAYNVIGCTIEHLVRDPRKHVILRHTLNYEGNRFGLDSRRQAAADELIMSASACEPIESRAYIDLAALLVDATSTPCPTRERIVTDQEVFETFQNLRNLTLAQALSAIARESETVQREALARVVMDDLPRGRAYVQQQAGVGILTYAQELDLLLENALNNRYARLQRSRLNRWNGIPLLHPRTFKEMFDTRGMGGPPVWPIVGQASRYAHIATSTDERLRRRGNVNKPHLWDEDRRSVTPQFYAYRRESIRLLAQAMHETESLNAWGTISIRGRRR